MPGGTLIVKEIESQSNGEVSGPSDQAELEGVTHPAALGLGDPAVIIVPDSVTPEVGEQSNGAGGVELLVMERDSPGLTVTK